MQQNSIGTGEMMDMLDIIHATISSPTMASFQKSAQKLQNLLGCSQSVFCWKSLGPGGLLDAPHILNVSFPEQFLDTLNRRDLWKGNPIAIRGMQQQGLQSWQDTFKKMTPSKQLLDLKHSFDLHRGYSFSAPGYRPLGVTMISLGAYDTPEIERWQFILNRLMPHFNLALNEILQQDDKEIEFPSLTDREIEVLSWLKEGKTSWEISVILNISERTINFHVANVKKKLNATNRMGAVAQAMHLRLVC